MPTESLIAGPGSCPTLGHVEIEGVVEPCVHRLHDDVDSLWSRLWPAPPFSRDVVGGVQSQLEAAAIVVVCVSQGESAILATRIALNDSVVSHASAAHCKEDVRALLLQLGNGLAHVAPASHFELKCGLHGFRAKQVLMRREAHIVANTSNAR